MLMKNTTRDSIANAVFIGISVAIIIAIVYPLYFVLIASFSDPASIANGEVWLFPTKFDFRGYHELFKQKQIWTSYWNTIVYTVVGTLIALAVIQYRQAHPSESGEPVAEVSETGDAKDSGTDTAEGDEKSKKKKSKKKKDKKEKTEKEKNKKEKTNQADKTDEKDENSDEGENGQTSIEKEEVTISIKDYDAGDIVSEDEVDDLSEWFISSKIKRNGKVFNRINGKSYRDNDDIALSDLRYLKILHYNFDHRLQVGEMICNKAIAKDVIDIFKELYEEEYEVEKMYLIDNYWAGDGDSTDTASIDENNTSCFCYRAVTGGSNLSNHAYGRAIDINPQQNPYVWFKNGQKCWTHENANDYIDRTSNDPHVMVDGDVIVSIFKEHGFEWGGNWSNPIDYQHFEKEG